MFIKLTKLDNTPIWLNASFIVTVEPRRGGGSIVVPIGDGLDYEVRETTEQVLDLLAGAPVPTVVPVPTKDSLTKTPDDVSPETEPPELLKERREQPAPKAEPISAPKAEPAPAEQAPASPAPADEPATEEAKPARKRATRKTAAAKTTKSAAKTPRKKAAPKKVELTPLALDDAQVERLRKMGPRSTRKLANTLVSQFKIGDPFEVIRALSEREVIKTEGDRVSWPGMEVAAPVPPPEQKPDV